MLPWRNRVLRHKGRRKPRYGPARPSVRHRVSCPTGARTPSSLLSGQLTIYGRFLSVMKPKSSIYPLTISFDDLVIPIPDYCVNFDRYRSKARLAQVGVLGAREDTRFCWAQSHHCWSSSGSGRSKERGRMRNSRRGSYLCVA
jgi:hypothetical protein